MPFSTEFITLALIHFVAVISPGPDFAIVVRHSIAYGRKAAIYTSLGIGAAIMLHVTYSLVGLSLLIKSTPWLYNAITYLAALYLIYLALGALRSTANSANIQEDKSKVTISWKKAFSVGFLTNGLNPKATLFFLSVFTVVIDVNTSNLLKLVYGLYLSAATALWFVALSYMLGTTTVAKFVNSKGHLLDRLMGILLIGLAIRLVIH